MLLSLYSVLALTDRGCQKQFNKFVVQYKKRYSDAFAEQTAKETFCHSLVFIENYNRKNTMSTLAINEFSDQPSARRSAYIPLQPQNVHQVPRTGKTLNRK